MQQLLLLLLPAFVAVSSDELTQTDNLPAVTCSVNQGTSCKTRIPAVEFKNQKFCRLEVPDFDFDARFSIVSADVYFSDANFRNPVKRTITSNSFQPLSDLMKLCIPGTSVSFDNIKVKGPDNFVRTIAAVSYELY